MQFSNTLDSRQLQAISPTFYEQLLRTQIEKARKIVSSHHYLFALLGSLRVKA